MGRCSDVIHEGVVEVVERDTVVVKIPVQEACGTCRAKEICGKGEGSERCIDVRTDRAMDYVVGEMVYVTMKQSSGYFALFFAYILPFLLIFTTLLILLGMKFSEPVAGLSSLAVGGVYYIVMFFCKKKIQSHVSFEVTHR